MARRVARYCKEHRSQRASQFPYGPPRSTTRVRDEQINCARFALYALPKYSDDFETYCPVCEPPIQLPEGGILQLSESVPVEDVEPFAFMREEEL